MTDNLNSPNQPTQPPDHPNFNFSQLAPPQPPDPPAIRPPLDLPNVIRQVNMIQDQLKRRREKKNPNGGTKYSGTKYI